MATIRNFAQLAGVSLPTVSRVFNNQRVDPVIALEVCWVVEKHCSKCDKRRIGF